MSMQRPFAPVRACLLVRRPHGAEMPHLETHGSRIAASIDLVPAIALSLCKRSYILQLIYYTILYYTLCYDIS